MKYIIVCAVIERQNFKNWFTKKFYPHSCLFEYFFFPTSGTYQMMFYCGNYVLLTSILCFSFHSHPSTSSLLKCSGGKSSDFSSRTWCIRVHQHCFCSICPSSSGFSFFIIIFAWIFSSKGDIVSGNAHKHTKSRFRWENLWGMNEKSHTSNLDIRVAIGNAGKESCLEEKERI